jgi:lysophospholipase L1-like esterase
LTSHDERSQGDGMALTPLRTLSSLLVATSCWLAFTTPILRGAEAAPAVQAAAAPSALQLPASDDGLPGSGPIRRYDWFQKLWNEKRAGWAKDVAKDQGAIVFLGDSITQGWGDVPSYFPGVKVANRGISGDTSRGVLIRLKEDVLALNPKAVVLLIGTNDIEEGADAPVIAGNMKLILDALKEHSATMPVVLCRVMPSSLEKKRPAEKIRALNRAYFKLLTDQPQVTVLDTWALYANEHGDAPSVEFPDLLHPNVTGYGKWSAALHPIMETLGLIPSWADDFVPEKGFTSLFNGRDLSGWVYADQAPLDKATQTPDGRYRAANGRLVVTVARVEGDYKKLWTAKKFPNDFVLRLEFRASPNSDSGIYIREPQLQCRDYLTAGPYTTLKSYRPLDWNEVEVTVKGGIAHATCNGEVLADAFPVPGTGPIGLESDRGQMEYRRIRIRELR